MLNIEPKKLKKILSTDNVATLYNDNELGAITSYLMDGYKTDCQTMKRYKKRAENAMKLARMDSGGKDKTFPFVGASNIMGPYLMEAAIEFNARTMPEFNKTSIAKAEVIGEDKDKSKQLRAERVKTVLDYVINHELDADQGMWRSDTDRALMYWPICGMFFRKNWQCPVEGIQKSSLIFGTEMIYDHSCDSFYCAPRQSHCVNFSKNEAISKMRSGQFVTFELPEETTSQQSSEGSNDSTKPVKSNEGYEFIEMHCELDLDGDDYAEPYIVTIFKTKEKIASIVKRFDDEDIDYNEKNQVIAIEQEQFFTQYGFIPDPEPESKSVFVGWGILLNDILCSINTNTNQLIDAGTLQNTSANSGFVDSTARVKKGRVELIMGQFTQIQTGTTARPLRDSIAQFPFNGPSQSLFNLLEALKMEVRKMVTASYNLEGNPNEAAELYLARMQQALKVPNSLSIRLHQSMGREIKRIANLIYRYSDNEWYTDVLDNQEGGFIELDFDDEKIAISPTADPRLGSELERIQKSQIVYNEAKTQPLPAIDYRQATFDYLTALGVDDVNRLMPPPQNEQADQLAQLQTMYAQAAMQRDQMDSQAKVINAQANMLKVQLDAQKLEAEIENIISDTAKNLSDVDAKKLQSQLAVIKEKFNAIRGAIDVTDRAEQRQAEQVNNATGGVVAIRPGNQGIN